MELWQRIEEGDIRAAARLMRYADDGDPQAVEQMKRIYPLTGKARVIGVTGNPGAGKSTVVDKLISEYRKGERKVGVVAIDPTSPFSGGAILGDRIRMNRHYNDDKVFIRSLATRGHLGGLSKSTGEISLIMEAWGCDPVFVETVGVGQAEVDVVKLAQTSVVVMVPGMGDEIQAIKAGIMEIADIFVVNKADREGADRTIRDINAMLEMVHWQEGGWRPRVVKTVAFRDEGIDELVKVIEEHGHWLQQSGYQEVKNRRRVEAQFSDLLQDRVRERIEALLAGTEFQSWAEDLVQREKDPYTLLERVSKALLKDQP